MSEENKHLSIFRRMSDGDPGALSELYDEVGPLLRGIALRILPSKDHAEEVLDEVLMKVWKTRRAKARSRVSQEATLILATRNAAVRRLRAMRGLPPLQEPHPSLPEACLPGDGEMGIVTSRQELVRRMLNQMPASQKTVLDLVIFQGLSEEEAAQTLHEPLGQVKDRIRASLSFARQRMHILMGTWTAEI